MNIYPEHFEQKIGFDQIRTQLNDLCISTMGQSMVQKIRFSTHIESIQKMLRQVMEFHAIISTGKAFPSQDYYDVRHELAAASTPGSYIDQETLFSLKAVLLTLDDIDHYFNTCDEEAYPTLKALANQVSVPTILHARATEIIDEKGIIKDNASPELARLRKENNAKQRQVLRETKHAFDAAKKAGWVPDNSEITIRNGRSVIPMYAADKRSMNGIIHDESSSGQTVFIETTGSFEINNAIRKLEGDERREIIKILVTFTDLLRPYIPEINHGTWFLGIIDFIRAKALFSIKIKANQPIISTDQRMLLKKAIHPLLFLAHREQNKEIIPLELSLNPEDRILLISGPNAGGKSVCLKTTGLLQYMLQCGLPVSASPDSRFRIFKQLFIDIGDEQSLENDLSTYSSHLLNMKYFLNHANQNTLILIDEFGTGTEPQLGGAIAEATLEDLNRKKTYGVITTHYTNLKLQAERTPGLTNGAMLFDSKKMQPLYLLQVGRPGSSFAFEIAKKIGFPATVLSNAANKSGGNHLKFDKQLQQLEIDKINLEKKQHQINAADAKLKALIENYEGLFTDLEKSKKTIIKEAKDKAVNIINDSNKAIEKTIRDIKEAEADKEKTRTLRENLQLTKEEIALENKSELSLPRLKKVKQKKKKILTPTTMTPSENRPLKIGDFVQIQDTNIAGELIENNGDIAVLNVNEVRLKTTNSKLILAVRPKQQKKRNSGYGNIVHELNQKVANFKMSIDLRGKRADEALSELQKYIDEAILLNMREVEILHGKGYGILREIIREYLQSIDEIGHFGDAPLDQGGAGITRVTFSR